MRIRGLEEGDVVRLPEAFAGTPWERSEAILGSMLEELDVEASGSF